MAQLTNQSDQKQKPLTTIYSVLENNMEYESELARLLFLHGEKFNTYYSLLNSNFPFSKSADITMMQDFTGRTQTINYQFDIMNDEKDCFMDTVTFLSTYGTHFENLVISNVRNTPILSIHITKVVMI